MNRGHVLLAAAVVLLATPLWIGAVLPHEPVHKYETHEVTADENGIHVDSPLVMPLRDVTCSAPFDLECRFVERVQNAGEIRINDSYPTLADEYAYDNYEWRVESHQNYSIVSLEPVSPETVLDGIARNPSPELEAALESGWVSTDYDVPAEHVVYATSDGYRVIGNEYTDTDAANKNELRGALSIAGVAVGFAALLRGQRRRVEAELAG
ncbi:hypothetical protein [Halobacterium zhouii]|uniref:hypothetical protein n=1 Tax=Halobacterium zhouii TaxID=2902624 RepID=UPI001E5D3C7D|nr:hypothetical protein [Halobacterium zhouii]